MRQGDGLMDLATIFAQLRRDNAFLQMARDPLTQFAFNAGRATLLGATLLPERIVTDNLVKGSNLRWRVIRAPDSARYAPPPLRQNPLQSAAFSGEVADKSIAQEMSARDLDGLREHFAFNGDQRAAVLLLNWAEMALVRPLQVADEVQRWQAILNAQVTLAGENGYAEVVDYPNYPATHRVAAGGVWSNNAYDPYPDILAGADLLASKGRRVTRIITTRAVRSKIAANTNMAKRAGNGTVLPTEYLRGRVSYENLNQFLAQDDLPPVETYDGTYVTQTGASQRYLTEGTFVMAATGDPDPTYDFAEAATFLPEVGVLGYTAIGRAAGQGAPGRVIRVEYVDQKLPPRVEGEAGQSSLPILNDGEALYVISGIS